MRWGRWKAVSLWSDAPLQLFNLETDIQELYDVSAQHPAVMANITAFAKAAHVDSPIFTIKNCVRC